MERKKMRFFGRVTGVGFRYRAQQIALELSLTGLVRNLSEGVVEVQVQGEDFLVEQFVMRLEKQQWIRIDQIEVENLQVIKEKTFQIIG